MAYDPATTTHSFAVEDGFQTTLSSSVTASTTAIPLTTLPSGSEGTLVIEPGTANEEEIYFTSSGAGVVNVPSVSAGRGINGTTAVSHNSGVTVKMLFTKAQFDGLKNQGAMSLRYKQGWVPFWATCTYASASTFTITGDFTSVFSIGDKIELTNSGTKYFEVTGVSYGSPDTTITVGNTSFTLANAAITSVFYSKQDSPSGFPNKIPATYAEITSDFSTTSFNTTVDVTNLSVTITVPTGYGKRILITAFAKTILNNNIAGQPDIDFLIREGSTTLANSGTYNNGVTRYNGAAVTMYSVVPTAGSHTYKVSLGISNTSGTTTVSAAATAPAFISVQEM